MRELLAAMEAKRKEARTFQDSGDTEKAASALTELDGLQKQYEVEEKLFKAEQDEVETKDMDKPEEENKEEKAFIDFVRGVKKDFSAGANGAVIPKTIASKIIETVKELSPIYARSTVYNVKGTLSIPVYGLDTDNSNDYIQAAYGTEFTDLTAHGGKFTSVDLTSLPVGALAKVSKSLVNNTDLDVLSFVTGQVAKAIADFMEKELLVGTGATGHMTGATKTTNVIVAGSETTVTAENLVDMQLAVPQVYQANACWIFNKTVFKAVRKLKDGNGEFLLIRDFLSGSGWTLLGKEVYISDNMPAVAKDAIPVLYGDFSGMACKLAKDVELNVLNELYAPQHAIGVVGWVEVDSKIENAQKFIGLKMAAA
jgi:HK97 family phage major capsid protein